jgi:HK97 family phage portal protein
MAWYNSLGFGYGKLDKELESLEKLNPAQPYYAGVTESTRELTGSYERAYEDLEIVNRGVNLIVDDCSEVDMIVHGPLKVKGVVKGIKGSRVDQLLNIEPNPYQDISSFRRNLITDYLIDGNIFIYFDGVHVYHLAASKMTINASARTFVESYSFNGGEQVFSPSEIIHVKENSFYSIYRGVSRLKPALRTMVLMKRMRDFQDNFFKNGAVPGLVLKSPNTLSQRIKDKYIQSWQSKYNPSSGGKLPMVLDGGMEIDTISRTNFKELDFQSAISENEKIILKALGIPPIMLDSGNNANIRPNMRMYYLETILPIVKKLNVAYARFFGFEITEDITDIPALQPELRDQSSFYVSLVNAGVITPNEARIAMNFEEMEGHSDIRVPQNIAGSAINPDEGGRPTEGDSEDNAETTTD